MSVARRERGTGEAVVPAGRDLVRAHLAGEPDAFDDIVKWYYPALLGHARRMLRDPRAAEDAVQEAFLRAYRALPGFAGEFQLGAWLHRIVINVCATDAAKRGRELDAQSRFVAEPRNPAPTPEEQSELADALVRVVGAIRRLPPAYREALVLRDVMDLEYADVADRSGITEDNARARVSRARALLKHMVEGSVSVGAIMSRGLRRGTAWLPRWAQQVANSAGAMSDAVNMPARAGAITAVATTGVAVVTVAAVPLISTQLSPPVRTTPPTVVVAGPTTTVGSARAAVASANVVMAMALPSTTTSTSSTSTTSTSLLSTTTLGFGGPAGLGGGSTTTAAPAPVVLGTMRAADVSGDAFGAGSAWEGSGTLDQSGTATQNGSVVLSNVVLPSDPSATCSGSLSAKWTAPTAAARPRKISVTGMFASETSDATATTYKVVGTAQVFGGTGGLQGTTDVIGTLVMPEDGSAGTLTLRFTQQGDGPACGSGSAPAGTTTSSTTSTTSTTAAP